MDHLAMVIVESFIQDNELALQHPSVRVVEFLQQQGEIQGLFRLRKVRIAHKPLLPGILIKHLREVEYRQGLTLIKPTRALVSRSNGSKDETLWKHAADDVVV